MDHIGADVIDIEQLLAETDSPDAGAFVVFGGTVRRHHDAKSVTAIEYSAYEPLAEKALAEVEAETLAQFDVIFFFFLSVVVVVRSAHRADAFAAGRFAIDTLKKTAPVWKRERYSDGSEVYLQGETLPGAGE